MSHPTTQFPGRWHIELDNLQKLLILRCLRPDKVVPAVRHFVTNQVHSHAETLSDRANTAAQMGPEFAEYPGFDLEGSYEDSSPTSPIVFILSAGSDPMSSILKFAEQKGMQGKLDPGQRACWRWC